MDEITRANDTIEILKNPKKLKQYVADIYELEKNLFCCGQEIEGLKEYINRLGQTKVEKIQLKKMGIGKNEILTILVIIGLVYLWKIFPSGFLKIIIGIAIFFSVCFLLSTIDTRMRKNKEIEERNKQNRIDLENDKIRAEQERDKVSEKKDLMIVSRNNMNNCKEMLNKLYAQNIIFPKYRNLPAISQFYEYLECGRCQELGGYAGAYNLYEQELRMNVVISKLDDIYYDLEEIRENQYMLYDAIYQTRMLLSEISNSEAVTAYNTEVIAANMKIYNRYYI